MMAGTSRGTVTPWRSLVVRTLSWVVTGTTVAFACTIARSRCTTTRSQRMPQRRRASWTKAPVPSGTRARPRGARKGLERPRRGEGAGTAEGGVGAPSSGAEAIARLGRGRRRGDRREDASVKAALGVPTTTRENVPTRWRSGDDARCAARARRCARRDRLGKRVAPILRGVPPRARARREHETRRWRKTWVGEPSNNHTETKKKNARVVGCRKRRPQHTRARPVDRVRSPRRHRDGRRSRDDRAGLTRSLRRARSPSRALRCDGRATRVSRHGARGAPGQGGDDARFHTLATAHDAALAELAATLRAPERYDWRDGRAAFDGGAPTVGGAAFDARRADAPGRRAVARRHRRRHRRRRRRRRARTPPLDPTSTLPRPRSPPSRRARVSARPRARAAPPSRRAIVSLAVNAGFVAAAALDGGVVVWHVPSGRLVDAFRFDDASEREANRQKKNRATRRRRRTCGGSAEAATTTKTSTGTTRCSPRRRTGPSRFVASNRKNRASNRKNRASNRKNRASNRARSRALVLLPLLVGHVARVTAALDVDGRRETTTLCTASLDATARTWRLERGDASPTSDPSDPSISATPVATPVATLRGHEAGLTCACVSGATLATCDARGGFRLWRLPNGDPTTTVRWGWTTRTPSSGARLPRGRKTFPEALDRDRDPLRLATAHYSREDDRGRVLVWRIGGGDEPVARVRALRRDSGRRSNHPRRIVDARVARREATNET